MLKDAFTGDGVRRRKFAARCPSDQVREVSKPMQFDSALAVEGVVDRGYNLLQRCISGALAKTVHGDADATCASFNCGDGICGCHAEVVVTVELEIERWHRLAKLLECRKGVQGAPGANGVGNAKPLCTALLCQHRKSAQRFWIGPRCVLRANRNKFEAAARIVNDCREGGLDPGPALADGFEMQ